MKKIILEHLQKLEEKHHIRIIYAIESGSRMWGFASENSDYDVRFIYINEPQYYLSVSSKPDYIEYVNQEHDFDMVGWDIKKALGLLTKSNMTLYEWLHAPIIYKDSSDIDSFQELAKEYWSLKGLMGSYSHLARHNYKAYIEGKKEVKLKKYLYIIRTIAACICIEKTKQVPPITVDKLLPYLQEDNKQVSSIFRQIIIDKCAGTELTQAEPNEALNNWIEDKISYYTAMADKLEKEKVDFDKLDKFFYDTVQSEHVKLAINATVSCHIGVTQNDCEEDDDDDDDVYF